jgi:hypothetical protein
MHGCIVQMPGVYIGRRGEAGKSEDVKKNGNEAVIRFLILFYFPDTPSLQVVFPTHCHIPTSPVCLAFGHFTPQPQVS